LCYGRTQASGGAGDEDDFARKLKKRILVHAPASSLGFEYLDRRLTWS
jgi:hypothetical protein